MDESGYPRLVRGITLLYLALTATAAGAWIWGMAGGFPIGHLRFWLHRVLPLLVGGSALAGIAALVRARADAVRVLLHGHGALWLVGTITATLVFPVSARAFLAPALVQVLGLWLLTRGWGPPPEVAITVRWRWTVATLGLGAMVAVVCVLAVRAPTPGTRPDGEEDAPPVPPPWATSAEVTQGDGVPPDSTLLGGTVRFSPFPAQLDFGSGARRCSLTAALRFADESPDGCWTLFSPDAGDRGASVDGYSEPTLGVAPGRRYLSMKLLQASGHGEYPASDGLQSVEVVARPQHIDLDVRRTLHRSVTSHLNSFSRIDVTGHTAISLEFSPCPGTRIAVPPFDPAGGLPMRCAVRDANGTFRILEAANAEKGPFRELARGPLGNGPLTVVLFDADREFARFTFLDWARQSSTDLSPTAGYGLPQNAIEFWREGPAPESRVRIVLTLAGTSLGRGYDAVGHAAGCYANRVTVEFGE